jgi:hypothetical protein
VRDAGPRGGPGCVDAPTPPPVGAAATESVADRISRLLLLRTPLGALVRWVARIPASVHTKLLTAFLLVIALFFAMGVVGFRIISDIARPTVQLDEAHRRVDSSRHIEHALAMKLNFTAMALLLRDEATIANVLRENNRFNSTPSTVAPRFS